MTTYNVTERLPDGRVRTVARGLSLAEAKIAYANVTWAGCIVQVVA